MFKLIVRKELRTAVRDVRLQVSAVLLIGLMCTAVLLGRQGQQQIQAQRAAAQTAMYDVWLDQGEKHPHSAAHYGHFAFKPKPVLSFLDVGLDNYTGVSVFLEAHQQNEVSFSAAQDGNGTTRFGELTAALILQVLFPLLIIFLTFNTLSREREEGTLRLAYAQGLSMRRLFAGKVAATYLTVLLIFLPTMVLAFVLLYQSGGGVAAGAVGKLLALTAGYAVYFFIFVLLCALVSAFTRRSEVALLTLLGLWIVCCIVVPKAATSLADSLYTTPSQFEFRRDIDEGVAGGIDGHNPADERLATLKQEVLDEYRVSTTEELPVNWSGIAMQAGEEYTDRVYDREFSKIEHVFRRQNRLSEWLGFLNPYLAIRHLSMALAGTDFDHHVAFARAAEAYRRNFVRVMNKDMELNHHPGIAFGDYTRGRDFWSTIEPFSYELPGTAALLAHQWRSLAALLVWLSALVGIAIVFTPKISPL